jgi:tRNA dimethylallyltransferase
VAELAAVLRGEADLEAASTRAIDRTRQYLKRQTSWLRTQVLDRGRQVALFDKKFSDELRQDVFMKILKDGLTG